MSAVVVNEARLFAVGSQDPRAGWWIQYRMRAELAGRVRVITPGLAGDLVSVECESSQDAKWLIEYLTSRVGIPRSAVAKAGKEKEHVDASQ